MYLQKELRNIYPAREVSSLIPLIMEHSGYPFPGYIMEPDRVPGPDAIVQINEIVTDIHTCKPIQYILGHTMFCELEIRVSENVLIPRPETEELVYRIIEHTQDPPARIIDLGTGSGCIALAMKKAYPEAEVTALEWSLPALEMARKNGVQNRLRVEWVNGDMLNPSSFDHPGDYDLVVSNPPYVLMEEKKSMERNVLEFEPTVALFVEDHQPLVFYHALAGFASEHLTPGGSLWVEINERFGADTARVLEQAGMTGITIHKDIHEKERFIEAKK